MRAQSSAGSASVGRQSDKMTRSIRSPADNREEQHSRKRREKFTREAHRQNRQLTSYLADDENFPSFKLQLSKMGLQLRDIPGDGNCLFRALGDQLEGHCRNHFKHRTDVVSYMRSHRLDFEPFVEDDISFDEHLQTLQTMGTHAGNDAIVAFARLHHVNIFIHQLNGQPLVIQGCDQNKEHYPQLHLAYHNGDHYSSVRTFDDSTQSPSHIRIQDTEAGRGQSRRKGQDCFSDALIRDQSLADMEEQVALATNCRDEEKVRQVLCECDYDVDASIADLFQQMELCRQLSTDSTHDNSSLLRDETNPVDGCSNNRVDGCSRNCCNWLSERNQQMHLGEQSLSDRQVSSYKHVGARPKIPPAQQVSRRKTKETKKMEKKKRAEERRREKIVGSNLQHVSRTNEHVSRTSEHVSRTSADTDLTVVSLHNGHLTRI